MLYVSLPVHEKPEVIVNQMQNFARYLPEARVVLHISKGANFSISALEHLFKKENIKNGIINPIQVETQWGNIIQAHLENIRYIIKQGNAEKVAFHSSNDMLIMDGLSKYLKDKKNIFQLRKCTNDSLWWVSRRAVSDSSISSFFDNNIYASQIEGSMYEIQILESLLNEIDNNRLSLESSIFYPREEIVFSSFVHKNNIMSDGLPYVYSEIQEFDRSFFRFISRYPMLFNQNNIVNKLSKKFLEIGLKIFNNKIITLDKITSIIGRDIEFGETMVSIDGKELTWVVYNIKSIFGVKRIDRDLTNSIRIEISKSHFNI